MGSFGSGWWDIIANRFGVPEGALVQAVRVVSLLANVNAQRGPLHTFKGKPALRVAEDICGLWGFVHVEVCGTSQRPQR